MSPSEGLAILKNWETQDVKLQLISADLAALGLLSTPARVAVVGLTLMVSAEGSAPVGLDLTNVEFAIPAGSSGWALQLRFPDDGRTLVFVEQA